MLFKQVSEGDRPPVITPPYWIIIELEKLCLTKNRLQPIIVRSKFNKGRIECKPAWSCHHPHNWALAACHSLFEKVGSKPRRILTHYSFIGYHTDNRLSYRKIHELLLRVSPLHKSCALSP